VSESFPSQFRVLVLQELVGLDIYYVAVALERYVVAQALTLEELRPGIERLLAKQKWLDDANGTMPYKPAPESYQRLRNRGERHIEPNARWRKALGEDGLPIVARWDIDVTKSAWQAEQKHGA